jgi:hypothetical protein
MNIHIKQNIPRRPKLTSKELKRDTHKTNPKIVRHTIEVVSNEQQ